MRTSQYFNRINQGFDDRDNNLILHQKSSYEQELPIIKNPNNEGYTIEETGKIHETTHSEISREIASI